MNSKKLLAILSAAGVAVNIAGMTVPVAAGTPPAALEQFVIDDPASLEAAEAFDMLAARFKDKNDKGRPDVFGPPGKPAIGPPGHYEG